MLRYKFHSLIYTTSSGQAAQSRGIPGLGDAQFGWESGKYGRNTWRRLSGRLPPRATDLIITCRFFQLTGVCTLMRVYGYARVHVCVCIRVPRCVRVHPRAGTLHRGARHQCPEVRECTHVHVCYFMSGAGACSRVHTCVSACMSTY